VPFFRCNAIQCLMKAVPLQDVIMPHSAQDMDTCILGLPDHSIALFASFAASFAASIVELFASFAASFAE
jgi:hypothetical protein